MPAYENKISILLTAQDEASAVIAAAADQVEEAQGQLVAGSDSVLAANDALAESYVSLGASFDDYTANMASIAEATDGAVGSITVLGDTTQGTADVIIASNDAIIASYRETAAVADESAAQQDASTGGDLAKGALGKVGLSGALSNPYVLAGAAVAASVAVVVKAGANFQQAVTQLYTTAGETAPLKTIEAGILSVATVTGESISQLTQGLYYISSAGYTAADGLDILKAAAEGAKAENADLATVANALTTIMVDYDLKASAATSTMNQLITAVSRGKTTLQDLSSALSAVLPSAQAAGLSFAQVAGAFVTLTAGGKTAEKAAQDVNALISTLTKMTTQQTQAFQQMGLSAVDVSKNLGTEGLTGTLSEMFSAIEQHMGPDGLVIQSAMKNATLATQDMNTEIANSPKQLQTLEQQLTSGTISFTAYRTAVQELPEGLTNLGKQFEATYNQAHSFNNQLTAAINASPTFRAELQAMTGQSDALSAALLLTGGHQATFDANAKAISESAKGASSNIAEWTRVQGNLNTQADVFKEKIEADATTVGTVLLPVVTLVVRGMNDYLDVLNDIGVAISFNIDIIDKLANKIHSSGILTTLTDIGKLTVSTGASLLKDIPGFSTGTSYAPGGMANLAENGAELVLNPTTANLAQGSQVLNADETRAMFGASGGKSLVIEQLNVNNNVDAGLVVRQIGWQLANAA